MKIQSKCISIILILGLSQVVYSNTAKEKTISQTPAISTQNQSNTLTSNPRKIQEFPSLPTVYRETRYAEIQKGIKDRTKFFLKGRRFKNWQANRPKHEILEEFQDIKIWRENAWYSDINHKTLISRPDFMLAQDLLDKGYFRGTHVIAFDYNKTDGSYNSSTIMMNGQRFLALEAPSVNLTPNFFRLLQNHRVTQLVRLTPERENAQVKCYPYWKNNLSVDMKTNKVYLNLPNKKATAKNNTYEKYDMRYYAIENWLDHHGINPKILLDLILKVREDYDPKNGLLACHCHGGVGRTGTFIAGFLLLQEIDKKLAKGTAIKDLEISIEKMVMELSLQRFHMVAKPEQYVTLYRLVDLYIQNLAKN